MAIVCLEGASGVGKTTVAARLCEILGAAVVPEVNLLFRREPNEPWHWYFERQADRWRTAAEASVLGRIAILDGDPFQPLWYNWAYGYDFGEPAERIHGFFADLLGDGRIHFPDRYFILTASEDELRSRKSRDVTRARKNFERHLEFIHPQKAYFEFLNLLTPGRVGFIENSHADAAAEQIAERITETLPDHPESAELFRSITEWLSLHSAEEFI